MLEIDSGWPEKLTRFFPIAELGTRNWKLETANRNWKLEKKELGTRGSGLAEEPEPGTKPFEATGLNSIIIKEIRQKWEKRSHSSYPSCYQSLTAISWPIFENLGPVKGSSLLPIWGGGQQTQTDPTQLKLSLSMV